MARRANNEEVENPERLNRIVSGAEMEGHLEMSSSLRLDGQLNGSLNCKGRLVLGKSGKIDGNIACKDADVEGVITGNIIVSGTLNLRSTAKIVGDITTQKIVIENGAEFNGTCNMKASVEAKVSKAVQEKGVDTESQIVY